MIQIYRHMVVAANTIGIKSNKEWFWLHFTLDTWSLMCQVEFWLKSSAESILCRWVFCQQLFSPFLHRIASNMVISNKSNYAYHIRFNLSFTIHESLISFCRWSRCFDYFAYIDGSWRRHNIPSIECFACLMGSNQRKK